MYHFKNLKNLIHPFQTIHSTKPLFYKIGVSTEFRNRLKYDYSINQNFRFNMKNKNSIVKQEEVLCSIYNLDIDLCYLFYTPYNGKIANINYPILYNIKNITENNELDNWLFEIKMEYPYKYNTYS